MTNGFKKLNLSTQMLLSSLAFILPLAVLAWFMDISFRYDLGIVEAERAGISYIRNAVPILHDVVLLQQESALGSSEESGTAQQAAIMARIDKGFDALLASHKAFTALAEDSVVSTIQRVRQQPDPIALASSWRDQPLTKRNEMSTTLLDQITDLISKVGDWSLLTVDPAHDSSHLADIVIRGIPASIKRLHLLTLLTRRLDTAPDDNATMIKWHQTLALLRDSDMESIRHAAHAAMVEDAAFYGLSPTLHGIYATELAAFNSAITEIITVANSVRLGEAPFSLLRGAALDAVDTQIHLMMRTLDELETLIALRKSSYIAWRTSGLVFCLVALTIALILVFRTYRNVAASLADAVTFSQNVAAGDYSRTISVKNSGAEMTSLAQSLNTMVEQTKHRIGYLDGILRGMTAPCVVVDVDERITFINQPYIDLFGLSKRPEHYFGLTISEFYYGMPNHKTYTGQAIQDKISVRDIELTLTVPEDRTIHIRYDVAPIFDLDEHVIGAFSVVTDLTTIREQQAEITRLASFPSQNPNPVLALTPDGSIAFANTAATNHMNALGLLNERDFMPDQHEHIIAAALASGSDTDFIEHTVMGRTYSWLYHPLPTGEQVYAYGTDITEKKRAEEQLQHDAFHDNLTGLPNHALFLDRCERARRSTKRNGAGHAVLLLDMDDFKRINDSLGHAMGDRLLRRVAKRLEQLMRSGDTLSRFGGDEFTVLLAPVSNAEETRSIAETLRQALAPPFHIDSHELFTTACLGVALDFNGEFSAEEMVRNADIAMYTAKTEGAGHIALFDPSMHDRATERFTLEAEMQRAIERHEFEPFYHPIVDLASGRLHAFEALARWMNPERGIVSPGAFIPLAEANGLILPIGDSILKQACKEAVTWLESGMENPPHIGVNLAVQQMNYPSIVDDVHKILMETGLPPAYLKLEITESGLMTNADTALDILTRLKRLGIALAIDDFGTGYSSLAYLTRFPFDYLKIDQSFVAGMLTHKEIHEIVQTIITLAHGLGKQVIAEGIETQQQMDILRSLGCEFGQGYLYAKPLPRIDAEALLHRAPRWG